MIIQLTDTHLLADPRQLFKGINPYDHLARVIEQIRGLAPQLVLVTGDLVHDDSAQGYRNLLGLLQTLPCPVRCLPGNHDAVPLMQSILATDQVNCQSLIEYGDWLCVLLDSSQPGQVGGRLGAERLHDLERVLNNHPGRDVIVAMHHPLLPCGSRWLDQQRVADAAAVWPLLLNAPCRVRAVVSGHIHQEFATEHLGIAVYGTPATAVQFRVHSADYALDDGLPAYRWLRPGPGGRLTSGIVRLNQF
ncbi:MAG: phosphodiesterase [Gammaproteobacteria bacterium]|nr:phosphodiesterase [Gammaproteobacteria bacterium]